MAADKRRIETERAPASTGFRSQGLVAGGLFFGAGQIGAAMPQPGVLREPSADMAEAVQLTLGHLDQVTLAAGLDRKRVFEVSAFPKIAGRKDLIYREVQDFLGFQPDMFTYHEVYDVAAHALIEMDWMATADDAVSAAQAAEWMRPLGHGMEGHTIRSGPFLMWNRLEGHGADLGEASHALLGDLRARLEAAGGGLEHLVKLTVYLYAFDPYPEFNEASKVHFAGMVPPTRSVLVSPVVTGSARIVVDAVALAP
jgi:enamine deaminase RidA (YjgF/YER057c/UK114 family)